MPSQTRSPGTISNDASFGTTAWSNPSNAASSNDSYATVAVDNTPTDSQYLKVSNFGFTIPAGATINGIEDKIEKSRAGGLENVIDRRVRVVKGGVIGSTDKADATSWPTTDTIFTYGGASDLWGETWTDSDVNASNFGGVIAAGTDAAPGTAQVDHWERTVHYTEAAGPGRPIPKTAAAVTHPAWADE